MAPAPLPFKKEALSPSALQKKLQQTVAIAVPEKISGGPTIMIKILKIKYTYFIMMASDPSVKGSIGYLESLLRGEGQFDNLWIREELISIIPENID
jgi:hypothetical protein